MPIGNVVESAVRVNVGDRLNIEFRRGRSAVTFNFTYKLLLDDGQYVDGAEELSAAAAFGSLTKDIPLANGWLLLVAVATTDTTNIEGDSWVRVALLRGTLAQGQVSLTLLSGSPSVEAGLAFPRDPTKQQGDYNLPLVHETIASPAAGADWSKTFEDNQMVEILACSATFTAGAAAANRTLYLRLGQGVTVGVESPSFDVVTANGVANVRWFQGASLPSAALLRTTAPLPMRFRSKAMGVRGIANNIQAADQWSAITLTYTTIPTIGVP